MEIKPVKKAGLPKYPVKEQITGKVLKAEVPARWTKSAAAKIALGAMAAMTLAGCTPPKMPPDGQQPPGDNGIEQAGQWGQKPTPTIEFTPTAGVPAPSETPVIDDFELAGEPMMPTITAAPLFVHGDGRGAMGCVMIAPPVFLSEQEALEVINEVAVEYGISFSMNDAVNIYSVEKPVTSLDPGGMGEQPTQPSGEYVDIAADFTDQNNMISIEFVSVDDVEKWAAEPSGATVLEYDTKDAAQQLQKGLQDAFCDYSEMAAGVLYDPCAQPNDNEQTFEDPEGTQEQTRETAVDELKAQVKDFFEWLKDIGVL